MKRNFTAVFLCVLLLFCCVLCGCAGERKTFETVEDFRHARIGVQTGTSHNNTIGEMFPEAERVYFNSIQDMILAVEQGKIDCYAEDEPFYVAAVWSGAAVTRLEEPFASVQNAYAFPKDGSADKLKSEMDEFILRAKEEGVIDRLREKWLAPEEPEEQPDDPVLTGENGTLKVAAGAADKPISYQRNGRFTGLEVELLIMFAEEYGYALEFEAVPFEAVIMGLAAGKYDVAASCLNVTEERKESVLFSEPYTGYDAVFVISAPESGDAETISSLEELENGTVAVLSGSVYEHVIKELLPDAEIRYFSTYTDIIVGLDQGKIDAYFEDRNIYLSMRWDELPVTALEEPVAVNRSALLLSKDPSADALAAGLDSFIMKCEEDGRLETLRSKWLTEHEPTEHPDYTALTGENGTLKIAAGSSMKPMSYQRGNLFTGLEIELLTMFAEEYGYRLEFEAYTFDGIIPAVTGGKCDIGAAGFFITPERAESVRFTESHSSTDGVVIVADRAAAASSDFFGDLSGGFEKTFIREDRWKLILSGIGVTMLISLCSTVCGSALGFGLYLLRRAQSRIVRRTAEGIAKVYTRIIAGTPAVVILMLLYYVVFGSFRDISGILVAVIGFTLTFGAFVYDNLNVAVNSVDRGQTEAAYALGYGPNRTFFRIVLPQAMKIFLPGYCGEAVSLVKATSIVGYIAVNDLTKIGDIIRSNTYEAFFPLIATAVIYFILTWILSLALGALTRLTDPRQRSTAALRKKYGA